MLTIVRKYHLLENISIPNLFLLKYKYYYNNSVINITFGTSNLCNKKMYIG